jgi:hypothetical protein
VGHQAVQGAPGRGGVVVCQAEDRPRDDAEVRQGVQVPALFRVAQQGRQAPPQLGIFT